MNSTAEVKNSLPQNDRVLYFLKLLLPFSLHIENEMSCVRPNPVKKNELLDYILQNDSMKNEFNPDLCDTKQQYADLYLIVNSISAGSLSSAIRKQSFIVNDVPKGLEVSVNENMLAAVISNLLHTMITHTSNSCIRISARSFGNVILVHVKESHSPGKPVFAGSLREVQQLAGKIGGTVSINSDRSEATMIVFSFVNNVPQAA
jgi:hypothetical protein